MLRAFASSWLSETKIRSGEAEAKWCSTELRFDFKSLMLLKLIIKWSDILARILCRVWQPAHSWYGVCFAPKTDNKNWINWSNCDKRTPVDLSLRKLYWWSDNRELFSICFWNVSCGLFRIIWIRSKWCSNLINWISFHWYE